MYKEVQERRILIFTHDGRGLGHLNRLSRVAAVLQRQHAVLVVTGHRAASWVVPPECEFVHLPSLDSLERHRSQQWGRTPFWRNAGSAGRGLRDALLRAIVHAYKPEVIMLDYLPMGRDEEMFEIIDTFPNCKKYFIMRGILDTPERVAKTIFTPKSTYLLEERYTRIFVAADQTVVNVATEYELSEAVQKKMHSVGYVVDNVTDEVRLACRGNRGLPQGTKWVVCSAGGGRGGEELTQECFHLAATLPHVYFDIVTGPRSTLAIEERREYDGGRIRLLREEPRLPIWHASCDVMISLGGYNSLLEGMVGGAAIISLPIRGDMEQRENAERFSRLRPLHILNCVKDLGDILRRTLKAPPIEIRGNQILNLNGAENIARLIARDFRNVIKYPSNTY